MFALSLGKYSDFFCMISNSELEFWHELGYFNIFEEYSSSCVECG